MSTSRPFSRLALAGLVFGAAAASCARQPAPETPAPATPAATSPATTVATPAVGPAAATAESLAFDPAVRRGVLPNGMRYYVRQNARPEKRAELRLVVNVGSVLEDDDQRGLAHFLEHMAFNGTKRFEKAALVNYLESIGTRFGPGLNAVTSFDETIYQLQVPTDSARMFERGLDILEDWATAQTLDSVEIDKERGVVIEEWRFRQGAGMRMLAKQLPALLPGSKYADRLPIGGPEALQTFKHDALRRFYRTWYRPDIMAIVAVGDFDAAKVEADIRQRFGSIPKPATPTVRPQVPVPPHAETLVAVATDPEATSSSVSVLWKQPLRQVVTVADYRRDLVEGLYNAMLNQRLSEIAQKPNAPFLGAGSGGGGFVRAIEIYQLSATVKDSGIVRGLEAVLTEAERVARHGFVATELEREKADFLASLDTRAKERERTNSNVYASQYASAFLEGDVEPGQVAELELAQRLLPTITLPEVNAVATSWLTAGNRAILVSAPEKAGLVAPTEAELRAVLDRVRGAQVAAYVDNAETGALVEKAPAPGRITARKAHAAVGVTEWTLSNGARVLVKPTDFKADEVIFSAYSAGGSSLAPDSVLIPAITSVAAVSTGGVGRFSRVDLGKALSGKVVGVQPYIGDLYEGFNGRAAPKDLETLLQLTHLYFTAPRRDSAAWIATRQQIETSLKNRGASPDAAFQDTMQATLTQRHRRSPLATPALVEKLDLDRSLAFYRDRFRDASDFTFVFVGNVTPEELEPLATQWLASLPSTNRKESFRNHNVVPPAGVVERVVKKGVEPKSSTNLVFHGAAQPTTAERASLSALREVLDIRLREVLREEKGGTYGVGVQGGISAQPAGRYTVSINFSSAPERADELTKAIFANIDSLKRVEITAEELQKVRELQRRSRETNMKTNGWWAGRISGQLQEGRALDAIVADGALIDTVTPAMIRAAAQKYLDTSRYVRGTLYPESFQATAM